MKEDSKQLLMGFYLKFCQDRRAQYWRYWTKNIFKRVFNHDKATVITLGGEMDFFPSKFNDFDRFVKNNNVPRKDIDNFLDSLKLHKEEYVNRTSFLVIFGAMLAIGTKLVLLFLDVSEKNKLLFDQGFYSTIFVILIVALIERDGIVKRTTASMQLITVIENWQKNQSTKNKSTLKSWFGWTND